MKNLLEKLKSVDKKILIASGVGFVMIIAALVVVLVVSNEGGDVETSSQDVNNSEISEIVETSSSISSEAESENSNNISSESSEASSEEGMSSEAESDVSNESDESDESQESDTSDESENSSETNSDESSKTESSEYTESTSSEPSVESEESSEDTESSEPESSSVYIPESSEPEDSSEEDISSEPEDSSEYTESEESSEYSEESSEDIEDESSEPDDESSEPDDSIGEGTKDNPILEIPDGDTMTVVTVKIPAGGSRFYAIYRVGGMYLNISDSNAYVVYDGTTYKAKSGKVSFKVNNALPGEAIVFEIGNNGSSAKSFEIVFKNPTGSFANPTIVESIGKDVSISLEAGAETGHYYKYVAEKNGKLRFYMTATADSVLMATNNRNSAQRSTEADVFTDDQGLEYIELEVEAGDEIVINVGAIPNRRGKYPATDITWKAIYA